MTERFGIYYAPAPESKLWQLGSSWLGRDCATGEPQHQPNLSASNLMLGDYTSSPRRYGFHATLKPPFALAPGTSLSELEAAAIAFSSKTKPVQIGLLVAKQIGSFIALVPAHQSEVLTKFAGSCVKGFERFRAPLTEKNRNKRLKSNLNPRQKELLELWGYPYVMEEFKMHLTLSDSLERTVADELFPAAENWFRPVLDDQHVLDRICLYKEPAPGAPFERVADFPLLG